MSEKRFRARKRYAHTRVWAITALILTLGGLALHALTRNTVFPQVSLGLGLAGLLIGQWQDRKDRIHYAIDRGQLLLRRRQVVERIDMDMIQDASLVDRRAVRDLLLERMRFMEEQGRIPAEREMFYQRSTRWCSVDIGLGVFSFGRDLMDRRPDGKYDLVLLRMRDNMPLLLSPVHNQDLISAINKGLDQEERQQNRA